MFSSTHTHGAVTDGARIDQERNPVRFPLPRHTTLGAINATKHTLLNCESTKTRTRIVPVNVCDAATPPSVVDSDNRTHNRTQRKNSRCQTQVQPTLKAATTRPDNKLTDPDGVPCLSNSQTRSLAGGASHPRGRASPTRKQSSLTLAGTQTDNNNNNPQPN